jgi:acyl-CoA thioesterase-2
MRYAFPYDPFDPEVMAPELLVWIRANGVVDGPAALHQCVVAYASDMTLIDTALLPHAVAWGDPDWQMASLDHAMWFHGEFRSDDWLLYAQRSPAAGGARGLATGQIFTRDGELVVSVVQEGLIRPRGA